jgi:valyl-tRNA synthetase
VLVPILDRPVPVVADDFVDREFGTGALKITPGHDPNDYLIGERHGLAVLSVLDEAARVNEHGGPYAGQDRFEARRNLWEDMRRAGLVLKEEPYPLKVPRSQRGGEVIEPMISTQWFVRMEGLAATGLEAVRAGQIRIVPERFEKVYANWLENIEDWCISRQLWWGHRIPVWYCDDCGETLVAREDPDRCTKCGSTSLVQDPDVLDTWFSSALWPFSTLGWPEDTPDLRYFYPTSIMETGYDILFFWVARMIMTGLEFTGQAPFHTVYLHGLIRDEGGRKMSKTAGNVIDPLVVMDELGTDALRFTLLVGSTPGNDMNLSIQKVEANRNFANKVWNAARFILGSLPQAPVEPGGDPNWTLADSWIWARLQTLIRDVERLFGGYQYGEAGRQIYDFFWGEFADWYLEIAKLQLAEGGDRAYYTAYTLVQVMDLCLRLLHPFTPFVTEELWGHLKRAAAAHSPGLAPRGGWPEALIVAPWPEPRDDEGWEAEKVEAFQGLQDLVRAIRNLRAEQGVQAGRRVPATFAAGDFAPVLEAQRASLATLARLDPEALTILPSLDEKPEGHVALVVGAVEVFLPLAGLVDPAEERERLEKELTDAQRQVDRLKGLLASPFAEKAPAEVVEKERARLAGYQETAEKIRAQLELLDG